jgi:hypothetical protein
MASEETIYITDLIYLNGGEGGIRTPDSLATMSDFESGAFNRALPPLRCFDPHFLIPSVASGQGTHK